MNKEDLIGMIGMVTILVSLLLAIFLLTVETKNKLGNRLFAFFIIFSAIDISGFFIYKFIYNYPALGMFRGLCSLLVMPPFYLYVLAVCYSDFKLKPRHLLHFIPFLVANLVMLPRFYLFDFGTKIKFFDNLSKMPEGVFLRILTEGQFIFYIVAVFLTLKKFKEIYLENYTDPTIVTYKWLFQLTVLSTVAHTIVIFKNLLLYTSYVDIFMWAQIVVAVVALCVLCWFVLKALYYPNLFRGIDSKLKLVKNIIPQANGKEVELEIVNGNHNHEKIDELRRYMEQEEPFLDPSLTVQDLANQMKMPVRELSILINHHLDQHFFDFVNEYRIKKAMKILKDPIKKEFTILEILYEVGFNSKSSFNTAFKNYTHLTPTQYRKSY